jgi:3-hydroxyisobutyrate dehydrogenase-like beta-hydroxyacid dehydrogenase
MPATATRIGFAGLGRMGTPMAEQLIGAGFELTVYNRTASVADAFARSTGAHVVTSPRQLAERSDVVVLMLADGNAVLSLLDGEAGLLAGISADDVVVDMGTSGVDHTATARERLAAAGAHLVEAPVSGSVASAESRKLLIMAAGEPEAVDVALPVLRGIADNVMPIGGPGTGAAMKLAVNDVLFAINQAIAEALVLAERAGIERSVAYDVFASSAVAAPVVHYRRHVFEHPESAPVTFPIDLVIKDLELVQALASRVHAAMPQAAANLASMRAASEAGLGAADMGQLAVHLRGSSEIDARMTINGAKEPGHH